jgi:hypothetical protein
LNFNYQNINKITIQVTLNIQNPQDWTLLLPLLERLGISIQEGLPKVKKQNLPIKNLAYHQAIIAKGGDASYFGDAAEWQREQRQERDLPFLNA